MRHIFIVNPMAGKSNAKQTLLPQILKQMDNMGISYHVEITCYPKHAVKLTEDYAKTGQEITFYAFGGDGTFNEVITGAWKYKNAIVACIPCGSGNDFVRYFTAENDAFFDMHDVINGKVLDIDLVNVNGEISANICSAGLDAKVAYGIPKFRRIPLLGGTMAYNMSIIQCLLQPLGNHMKIKFDDKTIEGNYLMCCVGNGQYYGGGYRGAPIADITDGVLDVIMVKKISRFRILPILLKYKKGAHFINGELDSKLKNVLSFYRTSAIKITSEKSFIINLDGECGPSKILDAKIMPKAAKVLIPNSIFKN